MKQYWRAAASVPVTATSQSSLPSVVAELGTIVSNYGDNKTQPLSYHFLSGASHFCPATAVGAVVRWPSGGEGCTVVAGGGGGPSLVPGSALPADCYVLQLRSALLSSLFSGLVTRHHRHHRPAPASNNLWFPQQQPAQQSSNWSLGQIFITV